MVTMLSTMMSSSSIMVNIPPCLPELWPFVYENSPFETMSAKSNSFDQNFMKHYTLLSTTMPSSKFDNCPYIALCFQELWPFVYENSPSETMTAL